LLSIGPARPTGVARFFSDTIYQNGENIPNDHKIYHSAKKYTKWPDNLPNGHEIYQNLPLQELPKLTQIGIFGFKTNPLAALRPTTAKSGNP
jgi:hypothetical protein